MAQESTESAKPFVSWVQERTCSSPTSQITRFSSHLHRQLTLPRNTTKWLLAKCISNSDALVTSSLKRLAVTQGKPMDTISMPTVGISKATTTAQIRLSQRIQSQSDSLSSLSLSHTKCCEIAVSLVVFKSRQAVQLFPVHDKSYRQTNRTVLDTGSFLALSTFPILSESRYGTHFTHQ